MTSGVISIQSETCVKHASSQTLSISRAHGDRMNTDVKGVEKRDESYSSLKTLEHLISI